MPNYRTKTGLDIEITPVGWMPFEQTEPAKPKEEEGDLARGFKETFQQLPGLGYGLGAGAMAGLEKLTGEGGLVTAGKEALIRKYQAKQEESAQRAKPSDSLTYSLDQARAGDFGSLVDWFQYGVGYAGGQVLQAVATAGVGSVVGRAAAGTVAKDIAAGMVTKEAEKLLAQKGAKEYAEGELEKLATANVAERFASVGRNVAMGASAFGMEGGEIFGEMTSEAQKEGRELSGTDLARGLGMAIGAGALEFVGDKFMADMVMSRDWTKKIFSAAEAAPGAGGRVARGALGFAAAAPVEAATEYFQTGMEEYGKGGQESILPWQQDAEAQRAAFDAAGLGFLGGTVGGAKGLLSSAVEAPRPVLDAPSVDQAIQSAMEGVDSTPIAPPKIEEQQPTRGWAGYEDINPIPDVALETMQRQVADYLGDFENERKLDVDTVKEIRGLWDTAVNNPEADIATRKDAVTRAFNDVFGSPVEPEATAQVAAIPQAETVEPSGLLGMAAQVSPEDVEAEAIWQKQIEWADRAADIQRKHDAILNQVTETPRADYLAALTEQLEAQGLGAPTKVDLARLDRFSKLIQPGQEAQPEIPTAAIPPAEPMPVAEPVRAATEFVDTGRPIDEQQAVVDALKQVKGLANFNIEIPEVKGIDVALTTPEAKETIAPVQVAQATAEQSSVVQPAEIEKPAIQALIDMAVPVGAGFTTNDNAIAIIEQAKAGLTPQGKREVTRILTEETQVSPKTGERLIKPNFYERISDAFAGVPSYLLSDAVSAQREAPAVKESLTTEPPQIVTAPSGKAFPTAQAAQRAIEAQGLGDTFEVAKGPEGKGFVGAPVVDEVAPVEEEPMPAAPAIPIQETKHTKTGAPLFVVSPAERVEREQYNTWLGEAKKQGGWYSSFRAGGAIPGFQFKTREGAEAFASYLGGEGGIKAPSEGVKKPTEAPPVVEQEAAPVVSKAAKLRQAAEALLAKTDEELGRERLTNTARRASMAANAERKIRDEAHTASTMANIADAIDAGTVTRLSGITAKTQVEALEAEIKSAMYESDRKSTYAEQQKREGRPATGDDILKAKIPKIPSTEGWYTEEVKKRRSRLERMGIKTDSDLREALREYLPLRGERIQEDPVKKLERELAGAGKSVGFDFFPTPKPLAARIAQLADIKQGDQVLEPSAGNGNLADAARAAGGSVDTVELSSKLGEILKAKGHAVVGQDFTQFEPTKHYDKIVMNPPFSNRLDAEHIERAYGMLKPGGKLVAIAGEGVFFGSDKKAVAFREWLDTNNATVEKLPEGTFLDKSLPSTTGVNARLIVMQKAEEAEKVGAGKTALPFEHAGFRIYKAIIGGKPKVTVQSIDNLERQQRGEREVGGDGLFDTIEQAKAEAERQAKRMKEDAEQRARSEDEAKKAAEAEAARIAMFADFVAYKGYSAPMAENARKALMKPILRDGKETTHKELMERLVSEGRFIGEHDGKRTLETADGVMLDEKKVGKTAIDYAEYLIAKVGAGATEPSAEVANIFTRLDSTGNKRRAALSGIQSRPDAAAIKYIDDNFFDILGALETSGKVKIEC